MNTVGLFCFVFKQSNLFDATTNTAFRDPNRSESFKNLFIWSWSGSVRYFIFIAGPGAVWFWSVNPWLHQDNQSLKLQPYQKWISVQ